MAIRTWIGGHITAPNSWNDPLNWLEGVVPLLGDTVIINSAASAPVLDVSTPALASLSVSPAGDITIGPFTLATGTVFDQGTIAVQSGGVLTSSAGVNISSLLAITTGGTVTDNGAFTVANSLPGTAATITVDGVGAVLNGTAAFIVGNTTAGSATVSNGGVVNAGTQIAVGQLNQSNGTLTIESGGIVTGTGVANIGNTAGSNGQVSILSGGTLALTGPAQTTTVPFRIGLTGVGTDTLGNPLAAAHGAVTVDGIGSLLDTGANQLAIGSGGGTGTLTIAHGGAVRVATSDSNIIAALSSAIRPTASRRSS